MLFMILSLFAQKIMEFYLCMKQLKHDDSYTDRWFTVDLETCPTLYPDLLESQSTLPSICQIFLCTSWLIFSSLCIKTASRKPRRASSFTLPWCSLISLGLGCWFSHVTRANFRRFMSRSASVLSHPSKFYVQSCLSFTFSCIRLYNIIP